MKKYLSKKRVCAILVSISMLISAIMLIPIPVEHVSAEDLYSAEEVSHYNDPIVLLTDDDGGESIIADTTEPNTSDAATTDIDTSDADTTDADTADTAKPDADSTHNNPPNNYIYDKHDKNDGDDKNDDSNIEGKTDSSVSDSVHCEDCEDGTCVCEHDSAGQCEDCSEDCGDDTCLCHTGYDTGKYTEPSDGCDKCGESCDETCLCGTELLDECEYCEGECVCGGVLNRSLMRAEFEILTVKNVGSYAFLNRIITANIVQNDVVNFIGTTYTYDTINNKIKNDPLLTVEIHINQDINLTSTITIPAGHNMSIISQDNNNNSTYALTVSSNIRHFVINYKGSLILENVTVRSTTKPNINTTVTRGGIDVNGGSLTLKNDAVITDNSVARTNGTGGGAVTVTSWGLFFMSGGTITNNYMNPGVAMGSCGGGGVYVGGGATIVMEGGAIVDNYATIPSSNNPNTTFRQTGGGGVYVGPGGKFAFVKGLISNNKARPSRGPQNGGGGIFIAKDGDLLMTGGYITENRAYDNTDNWQGGGGIFTAGFARMYGGEISNNKAEWEGGGVFVGMDGEFLMYEGKIINNQSLGDTTHGGGGVMIAGGIFETRNRDNEINDKLISNNRAVNNAGGFCVVAKDNMYFDGLGVLTIVDGTVITKNYGNENVNSNQYLSQGGAILINGNGTLNLFGGEIYNNFAGNNKGITWSNGSINLKDNPRVGGNGDTDAIYRHGVIPQNQVMTITGPLGNDTYINVRDDTKDQGRSDSSNEFTVIAVKDSGQGYATDREAGFFHYMGIGDPRSTWSVIPHTPDKDPRLILGKALTKFALLHIPDTIHFGERPLLTTDFVGPYGDAPRASNVQKDFDKGMENWDFGFEVANTRHNNWTLTLQAVPFKNTAGIIGAYPVAVSKDVNNPETKDIISYPLRVITRNNEKGESIKWHWTQLDYKIEAQTALDTVTKGDFQSVFSWTLLVAPT